MSSQLVPELVVMQLAAPVPEQTLLSSLETRGQDNWWLIDSGASVTVLLESALKNGSFRILSEEILKDGPRFFCSEWD